MAIGLSDVQFSLWSFKRLTKLDNSKVWLGFVWSQVNASDTCGHVGGNGY